MIGCGAAVGMMMAVESGNPRFWCTCPNPTKHMTRVVLYSTSL